MSAVEVAVLRTGHYSREYARELDILSRIVGEIRLVKLAAITPLAIAKLDGAGGKARLPPLARALILMKQANGGAAR